jgi:hypothetical protein
MSVVYCKMPMHRWASPFSPYSPSANRLLSFVSSSTNEQTTNFNLLIVQTAYTLMKTAWASVCHLMSQCLHVHISMFPCLHLHVSMSPCHNVHVSTFLKFRKRKTELTEKRQFLFIFCKRKAETANFCLFAANNKEKWTFFLGQQTKMVN